MSRQGLLRQLLRTTRTMVQGGLSETTRTCGRQRCACHRYAERRHGPHLYLTFRRAGKSRSLYIPPQHTKTVRQAQRAWARFWRIGCAIAALNRERLRREWKGSQRKAQRDGQPEKRRRTRD